MRSSRSLSLVIVAVGLAACSSNKNTSVDAKIVSTADASTIDAAEIAADAAPKPAGCDYGEQMDTANDDYDTGMPETTGLTFGTTAITICGDINSGHFDATNMIPDIDAYAFSVAADTNALLYISGTGGSALDFFDAEIWTADGSTEAAEADFFGDHGVAAVTLPAGDYVFDMTTSNSVATTATTHYKIQLVPDTASRCPAGTGTPAITEAHDGAMNVGNDVIEVPSDGMGGIDTPILTTSATDAPDNATSLAIGPATNYLVSGAAGAVTMVTTSAYLDRDTYSITTGATTNQLAINLGWTFAAAGATAGEDFDWVLFDNMANVIQASAATDVSDPEFSTVPVIPSTTYFLWIGLKAGSTPALGSYTANVCGEHYAAP